MSNKKTRRPSSSLYDRAAGTSRMELIREKAENEGAELIEDVELEATGDMNPKKVRWLSARASVGSWERWLWFSATVGLSVLCVILGVQLGKAMRNPPIYKETDLVSARDLVVEEEQSFYTSVKILDNGTITFPTDEMKYMGPPSQEIDSAWKELLRPQILALTDEEAGEMKDMSLKNDFGKRIMSLYVYHSLHCVNMVRKSFDFDYYYKHKSEDMGDNYRDHIYHCLDNLRQNIMCQGDLTPVPFYWDEHMKWPISNTTQPHTCRNHQTIRDWAMERRVGDDGIPLGLPVDMGEHGHI